MAAAGGHSGTVELLLDRGADLEAKAEVSLGRMTRMGRTACGRHGRAVDSGGDQSDGMARCLPLAGSRAVVLVAICEGCGR